MLNKKAQPPQASSPPRLIVRVTNPNAIYEEIKILTQGRDAIDRRLRQLAKQLDNLRAQGIIK